MSEEIIPASKLPNRELAFLLKVLASGFPDEAETIRATLVEAALRLESLPDRPAQPDAEKPSHDN